MSAAITVLASGDGSNLQAVIDACRRGMIDGHVATVISHTPGAGALTRARVSGATPHLVTLADRRNPADRAALEERVLALLADPAPDVLLLAGWMLVLSGRFLARCRFPVINVHPALLPRHGGAQTDLDPASEGLPPAGRTIPVLRGAHAVRQAVRLHLPYTGVSVHHVTEEVDAGPVLGREVVSIEETDDEASLYRRLKPVEHRLVVTAVESILSAVPSGGTHA